MYQVPADDMKCYYTKALGTIRERSDKGKAWRCIREESSRYALLSHRCH